jgi:3-deoxy-D-arabino-heptulosonate 7-phosphate (DAHP) synthase
MKVRDQKGEFNLKMLKSLERMKRNWKKRVTQEDQEVSEPLRGEEDRGVVADIIISPRSILAGKHTVVQARPLPENTENMERMN